MKIVDYLHGGFLEQLEIGQNFYPVGGIDFILDSHSGNIAQKGTIFNVFVFSRDFPQEKIGEYRKCLQKSESMLEKTSEKPPIL